MLKKRGLYYPFFGPQSLIYKIFINITDLHVDMKRKVKIIRNQSWMSFDGHNVNQGRSVKERKLGFYLGSGMDS